jgi:hypothetical protein
MLTLSHVRLPDPFRQHKSLLYTKCQSSCFLATNWTRAYHVTTALTGGHYFYSPVNNKIVDL